MGSRNNKPGRIVKGTALQPSLKNASGVWSLDEAMQAHRANAWPQPNLFQPISNSLRVKQQGGSTSAGVLSKSIVREGDRRRFTMSMWVKLGTLTAPGGSIRTLWEGFTGTDNSYYLIYITNSNQLYIGRDDNGTPSGTTATWAGVLRDPTAWYHIVIATDTLQSTAANRIKVWINGVQQTLGGDFPAQGYAVAMGVRDRNNNSITNGFGPGIRIGSRWNTTFDQNFDGLYGEVNFVDGYQLDPSLFGKFDTNNTWVPVAYTGSYGTNGFYLPFTNATTSQTLGYDASLNGTTTYDADQDPYRGSVALHLTGNGPAGGQNNTFADSGSTNNAISRTGNITQGSFSPYPLPTNAPYNPAINGASAYFPKSGWLSAPTAAVSSLGTGDFTFESWVYPLDFTTTSLFQRWFSFGTGLSSDVTVNIDTSGNLVFRINDATQLTSATSLTANAWNHVAFVRSSGTVRFYINGYSGNSASVATNITTQGQNPIIIGAEPGQSQGSAGDFFGYMSNFRIIKGVAIYTANFTPTNRPFGTLTNNLLTFSEDFTNSYWTQSSITVTPSAAVAPDGNPSATKLTASSTGSIAPQIYKYPNPNLSNSTTYTLSVYAKAAEYNYIVLNNNDGLGSYRTWFNLTTGTVGTNASGNTASMVSVGNGWYRCIVYRTMEASSAANSLQGIQISNADAADTFSATSGSGIYIWGAQIEQGTSATNYTPTPANFSTAPSLLLNFANAAVTDTAGGNNITTVSGATITSASKYGSGAMTFNGSSDYLTMPSAPFTIAGNFTIELWGKTTSGASTGGIFPTFFETSAFNSTGLGIKVVGGGSVACVWYNGSQILTGTSNIIDGAWHHIAVTRVGATMNLFVDGQLQSQFSSAATFVPGTVVVGGSSASSFAGGWLLGQVDDLRVTTGVARYQDSFTPPARALPETGGKSFVTTNVNAGVVQRFTTVGTTAWTAPTDVTSVEVLVVAGGGGGGAGGLDGGGGGAGGLIYNNYYSVTPGLTYTVTVGAGGVANGTSSVPSANGGNSVFGSLIAIGGGGGANGTIAGASGGSGGGGGGDGTGTTHAGGAGTAGQGFSGGIGNDDGGGGGGAGGVGTSAITPVVSNVKAGQGGVGLQFGISGTPTYYAGGGGGGGENAAIGGLGGGGSGGNNSTFAPTNPTNNGIAGTDNTGGGGGGTNNAAGGAGGSGIVIVRYTTTAVGNTSDATSDNLTDSPTLYGHDTGAGGEVRGNYCTLSPLTLANGTLSNGNLNWAPSGNNSSVWSTLPVNTGKWYFEITKTSGDMAFFLSPTPRFNAYQPGEDSTTVGVYMYYAAGTGNNRFRYNGTNYLFPSDFGDDDTGTVYSIFLDFDTSTLKVRRNNDAGSEASFSMPAALTAAPLFIGYSVTTTWPAGSFSYNFGQRAWAYAPPAGFNAIATKNLPRPTNPAIITPNQYIRALTWTGTGAAQTITAGFKPDFIWCKTRSNDSNYPILQNTVKGITYSYGSNAADAPGNYSAVSAVTSTGFTLGTSDDSNKASDLYIGYAFRAGGNSNTFNINDVGYATASAAGLTAGTITPTGASVSTTAGFSIIKYNGDGVSPATISHGLGIAPSMIWTKVQNASDATRVWHSGFYQGNDGDGHMARLSASTAPAYDSQRSTGGTTSTFRLVGNSPGYVNSVGHEFVAFVWAEIPGYSKFGTYTANASTDGPFVYCGFKPAWVMVKNITRDAGNWVVLDNALNTYNPTDFAFFTNTSARPAATYYQDFVSNGFKLRVGSGSVMNHTAGDTYIFAAYADKPFSNINGTAR